MFPSSRLFAHIKCYLFERGLCERPHCVFKHGEQGRPPRDVSGESTVDLKATEEATDECLQELERINREIENVKHQVEEEQRRLSHYQMNQVSERTNSSRSTSVARSKNVARESSDASSSEPRAKPKKYILDSSKPRTDLEYDPLSNFSSDLRSYCSSNKGHKTKNGHCSKREQSTQNQKTPNVQIPPLPVVCPEHSDSNEDENILIIDLTPSPAKTKNVPDSLSNNNSHLASANVGGKSKTVEQSLKPSNPISSKNDTSNNFIPNDENIFVKMTQHMSKYNNPNPPQPCEQRKTPRDRNSSTMAAPVNKTPTSRTQKPEPPGNKMAAADSPYLPNVKHEQNQPIAPAQPQIMFVGSLCEPKDILTASKLSCSAVQSDQQVSPQKEDLILIDNSSEDELNYSDLDVSESDPDEECYRIFMEANGEEMLSEPLPEHARNAEAAKVDVNLQLQAVPGKKRVAHETKVSEQPMAKVRPEPQVLVPLRVPVSSASQAPAPPMIRKVEQWASDLSASVKAGQASICKVQPQPQRTQSSPCSVQTKPAPYISYIPLGATVIDVGNNLHLVLPEGTFPVSNSSGVASVLTPITQVNTIPVSSVLTPITQVNTIPVSSVLTPITQVNTVPVSSVLTPITQVNTVPVSSVLTPFTSAYTNPITVEHGCHPSAQMHQRRTSQPVIIPPLARRPVMAATGAHQCSTPAPVVKPGAAKRKLKQQRETVKVPHDIRQSYVNKFTEEFLKTTTNVTEAFQKALAEERTVYNRSANKLKYLSVSVNALKRLRNQSCGTVEDNHQTGQKIKGNIPLNPSLLNGKGAIMLYERLKDYVLTEEMLIESNFPLQNPEKPGSAILFADNKKNISDPLRKLCCRCGATYSVSRTGKHTRKEECTYHYGKGVENKVPGGVETRYSCCQGVMGSPGCQVFQLHVCSSLSMEGFVSTASRDPADKLCAGVFSLNCEMCYTIHGLELSRVTVVNSSLQIVYDTFVRPHNEVIDYNTRFSGISQEDMAGHCQSLKDVQDTLLSFISADTILIGHGLDTDLCVLKLLHGTVVDTSVVFPHRLGPPHKLSLHSLTAEYLRKIIQESECGHDTAEDAVACMELIIWKAKEDGKLKKI
ncbi:uncharacterized protein [Eucyclogobius newberryi]|uniref:uncharacterized protein n=1 Tax=Eucyclogobius newberryi TaxID=166745 RepID=UPI003B5BF7A6